MNPRIEIFTGKKIIGKRLVMSLTENKTPSLWKSFMTERNEIKNKIGSELYSIQVYDPSYFTDFNPTREFEKWAGIEVTNFESVPSGMEILTLPAGLYAVFLYKGAASQGQATFTYIFSTWLPNSGYSLDHRPHFEVLGEKYKHEDPDSEEEIWIPIRPKA